MPTVGKPASSVMPGHDVGERTQRGRRLHASDCPPPGERPDASERPRSSSDRAERPVMVAVQAADPILGTGAAAYLRTRPGITPVPADAAEGADVILVLADEVSEEILAWMQHVASRKDPGRGRFVLVGGELRVTQLWRVISYGLVTVIRRKGCDYEQITQAILRIYQGHVQMPEAEFRSLVKRPRPEPVQTELLEPPGPGTGEPTGRGADRTTLNRREYDVLRLLAEGLGTREISVRLNYSERTVKNIIHRLTTRLKLRNRVHAVAYALRNGLL
jgi:DNA-binding NarL/FixJ family response regulator